MGRDTEYEEDTAGSGREIEYDDCNFNQSSRKNTVIIYTSLPSCWLGRKGSVKRRIFLTSHNCLPLQETGRKRSTSGLKVHLAFYRRLPCTISLTLQFFFPMKRDDSSCTAIVWERTILTRPIHET
eukprot:g55536.t1